MAMVDEQVILISSHVHLITSYKQESDLFPFKITTEMIIQNECVCKQGSVGKDESQDDTQKSSLAWLVRGIHIVQLNVLTDWLTDMNWRLLSL